MRYIVRISCEYSLEVEAAVPDEAIGAANTVAMHDWQQAWTEYEVEAQGDNS